jgi:hypothetical protein
MVIPAAPALDLVATGAHVLLGDGAILDATLPPGAFDRQQKRGWKVKKGTFTFVAKTGVAGITKLVLSPVKGSPGALRVVLKGKGGSFAGGAVPKATVVIDAAAGQCGDTRFAAPDCVTSAKKGMVRCE